MSQQYKVHPAANCFPMMDRESFEALKADIEKNGLREQPTFYKGQLIDGRNRMRACRELGITPYGESELEDDQDPVAFVLSANLHRRQLKTSQKAMCAAKMASLPRGNPNGKTLNLGIYTTEQAAELFGVSSASIEFARDVIKNGCKELIALCESGKSVATAAKFIDSCETKRDQSAIAKEGWKAIQEYLKQDKGDTGMANKIKLPKNPTAEAVAMVDAWLESQDERPILDRAETLWNAADDDERAALLEFFAARRPAS